MGSEVKQGTRDKGLALCSAPGARRGILGRVICLSSCKIAATFNCCCCGAKVASRLFDVFLASHPLMPMYVGVAAMAAMRTTLLACGEMHEAHATLSHIDLLDFQGGATAAGVEGAEGAAAREGQHPPQPPLERLLAQALSLMDRVPPHVLLGRRCVPL